MGNLLKTPPKVNKLPPKLIISPALENKVKISKLRIVYFADPLVKNI